MRETLRITKPVVSDRVFKIEDERIKISNYVCFGLGKNYNGGISIMSIDLHRLKTQYMHVVYDQFGHKCRYDVYVDFNNGSIEFCTTYKLEAGSQYDQEIPHLTSDIIFFNSPFHY